MYEWPKDGVEGAPSLEIVKLKKENLELKLLVADMLLKLTEAQKKKWP